MMLLDDPCHLKYDVLCTLKVEKIPVKKRELWKYFELRLVFGLINLLEASENGSLEQYRVHLAVEGNPMEQLDNTVVSLDRVCFVVSECQAASSNDFLIRQAKKNGVGLECNKTV